MEAKLDAVASAIEILTERIGSIEAKFTLFESKFQKIEQQLSLNEEGITDLTKKLNEMVPKKNFVDLCEKVKYLEFVADEAKKGALQQESCNKRLNLLIHGVEEKSSVWEDKTQTLVKLNKFLKEGLQIEPSSLQLVDMHRLPQRLLIIRVKRVTRSIIIKLKNASDKHRIMSNLKQAYLKIYNQQKREDHSCSSKTNNHQSSRSPVYVIEHLPQAFLQQKKFLLPAFKEARKLNKKTKWVAKNGEYCLFVDNERIVV